MFSATTTGLIPSQHVRLPWELLTRIPTLRRSRLILLRVVLAPDIEGVIRTRFQAYHSLPPLQIPPLSWPPSVRSCSEWQYALVRVENLRR